MTATRPTMRELSDERQRTSSAPRWRLAIAENRLTVRQMTSAERREADVRRAVCRRRARSARREASRLATQLSEPARSQT